MAFFGEERVWIISSFVCIDASRSYVHSRFLHRLISTSLIAQQLSTESLRFEFTHAASTRLLPSGFLFLYCVYCDTDIFVDVSQREVRNWALHR